MDVEIKIDSSCSNLKVVILTNKMTDEVNQIVSRLSENTPKIITGLKSDTLEILRHEDIYRIYSQSGKTIAVTEKGEYTLRFRLYEIEEMLEQNTFVRISNSEIINLNKVKSFDLKLTGTICVKLTNGTVSYVSRRYITKIKQILGI